MIKDVWERWGAKKMWFVSYWYLIKLKDIEANALDLKTGLRVYDLDKTERFLTTVNLDKICGLYEYRMKKAFKLGSIVYYKFWNEDIRRI